jgi:hypothetical protein
MPRVHPTGVPAGGGMVAAMAGAAVAAQGVSAGAMADRAMAGGPGPAGEVARAAMLGRVVAPVPGGGVMAGLMVPRRHAVRGVAVVRGA